MVVRNKLVICELTSNLIAYLKKHYTYHQLSQITDLPPSVLNRYVKRVVVPRYERAIFLYEKFKKLLVRHIKQDINGDNWGNLYSPSILDILSTIITFKMAGQRVTKILSFEDMSPLAISTAIKIGVPFVIITQTRNLRYSSWLSIDYRIGGIWLSYFIPKDSLRKNDSILYIDTIMTPIKDDVLTKLEQLMGITIEHKLILKNLIDELEMESA